MNPIASSIQGGVISAVTPPVPPHPPAVPSHKTPESTTAVQAVSPSPGELVVTSNEERTKSSSAGDVKPPKDSSPPGKLKSTNGENSGAEISPGKNITNG